MIRELKQVKIYRLTKSNGARSFHKYGQLDGAFKKWSDIPTKLLTERYGNNILLLPCVNEFLSRYPASHRRKLNWEVYYQEFAENVSIGRLKRLPLKAEVITYAGSESDYKYVSPPKDNTPCLYVHLILSGVYKIGVSTVANVSERMAKVRKDALYDFPEKIRDNIEPKLIMQGDMASKVEQLVLSHIPVNDNDIINGLQITGYRFGLLDGRTEMRLLDEPLITRIETFATKHGMEKIDNPRMTQPSKYDFHINKPMQPLTLDTKPDDILNWMLAKR